MDGRKNIKIIAYVLRLAIINILLLRMAGCLKSQADGAS